MVLTSSDMRELDHAAPLILNVSDNRMLRWVTRLVLGSVNFVLKILTAMTGWGKFLDLLHIFGLLGWDATTKFTRPDSAV